MRQHTGVDGFDEGGLGCGNVDLAPALAYSEHAIGRLGRADPDRYVLIDKKRGLLQVVATRISVERAHKLYLVYPAGFCAPKSESRKDCHRSRPVCCIMRSR